MTRSFAENPFRILGATPRQDNHRLIELAEERALSLDDAICQKARADLVNPRARLAAEIAWLPGLSEARHDELVRRIAEAPVPLAYETMLEPLVRANVMAEVVGEIAAAQPKTLADFIVDLGRVADDAIAPDVVTAVNKDRAASGFPLLRGTEGVEAELAEQKRWYRIAIVNALQALPTPALIDTLARAVAIDSQDGARPASALLDDVVDAYESEVRAFLENEAEKVGALVAIARESAPRGAGAVDPLIDTIETVLKGWHRVASPVLLSKKARGLDHDPATAVARNVRSLGVFLYNDHDMLAQSQRVTAILTSLFLALPEVAEQAQHDAEILKSLDEGRAAAEKKRREWEASITWQTKVGFILKKNLSISPTTIEIGGRTLARGDVTRARWGAIRRSVNGVPTGTTYTIGVGDNKTEGVLTFRDKASYDAFIERLWRGVGSQVMTALLRALRASKELTFGEAVIGDSSVTLVRRRAVFKREAVVVPWSRTKLWSADGQFVIGTSDDAKVYAAMSYMGAPNVHFIEHLIKTAFEKGHTRLSALLT